jgi:hypothetical protein
LMFIIIFIIAPLHEYSKALYTFHFMDYTLIMPRSEISNITRDIFDSICYPEIMK